MKDESAPELNLEQRVFIVDDDPAICESLCDLVESAGLVSSQFASAEEFLEICSPELAGCLVLDMRLPAMSGMELQTKLTKSGIAIPIIIMTAHGDIPMVRNAMKAGAVEFLTKPFQDEELLTAIEQAFALDRSQRRAKLLERSIMVRWRTLSERERQVLEMATAGMLNKQIADQLNLSLITVKLYRRQVMEKMQAETFADLVKMWERMKSSHGSNAST
ncbi:MAG TPA: response regulator [Terracidiphilus sp.]